MKNFVYFIRLIVSLKTNLISLFIKISFSDLREAGRSLTTHCVAHSLAEHQFGLYIYKFSKNCAATFWEWDGHDEIAFESFRHVQETKTNQVGTNPVGRPCLCLLPRWWRCWPCPAMIKTSWQTQGHSGQSSDTCVSSYVFVALYQFFCLTVFLLPSPCLAFFFSASFFVSLNSLPATCE